MYRKYHDPFEVDCFFHIYNRSINNESIFLSDRNYKFFLSQWKKYFANQLEIFAYCLIPNHFHFFIQVKTNNISLLEDSFKRFFSSYSLSFNIENVRTGSLFQKGYKRIKVDNDDYFTSLIHYINNNPIHHKLVSKYENWPYSSYNSIVSDKPTLVQREKVLDWFGGKEQFIRFHKENIVYEKIKDVLD